MVNQSNWLLPRVPTLAAWILKVISNIDVYSEAEHGHSLIMYYLRVGYTGTVLFMASSVCLSMRKKVHINIISA